MPVTGAVYAFGGHRGNKGKETWKDGVKKKASFCCYEGWAPTSVIPRAALSTSLPSPLA